MGSGTSDPRLGSSPLARGLRPGPPQPAWWPRDHPRSRGVYVSRTLRPGRGAGSSPLARGLPAHWRHTEISPGIIPARAGFTHPSRWGASSSSDHPRSRGVYQQGLRPDAARGGSSPLARGLLGVGDGALDRVGIIPARAGFTPMSDADHSSPTDHPRSRGVYPTPRATSCSACGSSPLARGLRGVDLDDARDRGIIPARAGFTTGWRSRHRRAGDHPRSRGVYSSRTRGLVGVPGSSPLARGLRVDGDIPGHRRWIIPARAGFT